jgi:hypothetical protein
MSDLQAVAAEFKKWKGNLPYCRYPIELWDKAYKLTEQYPLQTIASALGSTVQYLERKFSKRTKPITFASIQVTDSPPHPIKIAFKQVTLEATSEQVISVIQALMGNA